MASVYPHLGLAKASVYDSDCCLHQISLSILQLVATFSQVFSDCIWPPRKQLVQLSTFPPLILHIFHKHLVPDF